MRFQFCGRYNHLARQPFISIIKSIFERYIAVAPSCVGHILQSGLYLGSIFHALEDSFPFPLFKNQLGVSLASCVTNGEQPVYSVASEATASARAGLGRCQHDNR